MTIIFFFFFFNDTAPTEIYTLSLHDALPIFDNLGILVTGPLRLFGGADLVDLSLGEDRKSTRLNSSHQIISYAVFCLKKKTKKYVIKNNNITVYNSNNFSLKSTLL